MASKPARIRFIADGDTCTVFGATFTQNVWTTDHGLDDEFVAKLAENPTFEVKGWTAPDPAPDTPVVDPVPAPLPEGA